MLRTAQLGVWKMAEKTTKKVKANVDEESRHHHYPPSDNQQKEQQQDFPEEDDDHFRLFGKRAWEVEYGEKCSTCGKRIDEFGFCACGSAG
jgi:hypothetical protein